MKSFVEFFGQQSLQKFILHLGMYIRLPHNFPHCVKNVRIRSFSGPYFPAFVLNTDRYGVFTPNAGKYGPENVQIRALFTQCHIQILLSGKRYWLSSKYKNSKLVLIMLKFPFFINRGKNLISSIKNLHTCASEAPKTVTLKCQEITVGKSRNSVGTSKWNITVSRPVSPAELKLQQWLPRIT